MQDKLTETLIPLENTSIDPIEMIHNDLKFKADEKLSQFDKIDAEADERSYFTSMFQSSEPKKASFNEDRINIDESYTKLSDGSYITRYDKGYTKGLDNEDIYASSQSTGDKWFNGVSKFIGKTVVNTVGGVAGTAWGAISAISEGNWERVYDNSFYDLLDDQNTKMDTFQANYRAQQERDMGFFESSTTANFWADDFLGGLSFMAGTVLSEGIWATATGGASLATSAARVAARGSKVLNTAKNLTKGLKEATKTYKKYERAYNMSALAKKGIRAGKVGKVADILRFTYTSAGFEAGMEARLYKREQRDAFNKDFKELNGREATPNDIANFEKDLDNTANTLWATNMALVGTSNLAILGKTFGITSPFKTSNKYLDKKLFGKGVTEVFEKGQRISTEAIKRTKLQRGLGVATGVLKNPFYEGFVEEGGQATASSAMENYITSRYNLSEDAMSMTESVYNGFAHTYGTKEGWKEVGLGMLIGLVGGEGSSALSGNGVFKEARDSFKEVDEASELLAQNKNKNRSSENLKKIFAAKLEEDLVKTTDIENATKAYEVAENKGDVMGMAEAQSRIMLTSVSHANKFDYAEEQIEDFVAALNMEAKPGENGRSKLGEHYDISEDKVETKITQLTSEYRQLMEDNKTDREFVDYFVSENPKELSEFFSGEDGAINMEHVKDAMTYQMGMARQYERSMEGAHEALVSSVGEMNNTLAQKFTKALSYMKSLRKAEREDVNKISELESKIKLKSKKYLQTESRLALSNNEDNKKVSKDLIGLSNELNDLNKQLSELQSKISDTRADMSEKSKIQYASSRLNAADPLAGQDSVEAQTIEDTQKVLKELDEALLNTKDPKLTAKIRKLAKEYNKGLEMWKRNAQTVQDMLDPDLGLDRVGTMFQKKRKVGNTTLEFLKKLDKTYKEEGIFNTQLAKNLENQTNKKEVRIEESNIDKARKDKGADPLNEEVVKTDTNTNIENLKNQLKKLVGENSYILDNFSNDEQTLSENNKPTQEDLDRYSQLRDNATGDVNKLVGKDIEQIGNRTKERSNLTADEIVEYQKLSQKMLDWRVVTGTSSEGISIQDILDTIEALSQEIKKAETQVTAQQVIQYVKSGEKEFSAGAKDVDIVQTPSYVMMIESNNQVEISHLELSEIEKEGYQVNLIRTEQVDGDNYEIYEISKDNQTFEIRKAENKRLIIHIDNMPSFMEGMGIQEIGYNTSTKWSYLFKDGELMKSLFTIKQLDKEGDLLNAELLYKMKPGDKLSFSVSISDMYNADEVKTMLDNKQIDLATINAMIYIKNEDGKIVGMLKAGKGKEGSNFNKVREAAVKILQDKFEKGLTIEDVLDGNVSTDFKLPFETEVDKIFTGTPNLKVKENGEVEVFKISEKGSKKIVGKGFSKAGKLSNTQEGVRMSFIPQDVDTPYVIIEHRGSKIAYPVAITPTASTLQKQVLEILKKDDSNSLVEVINLLARNGVDANQFNLDALKDNTDEINKILKSLDNATRTYSVEEIKEMTDQEFIASTEITIDLETEAFLSPKLKTTLSQKLYNVETKEETKDKPLTENEKATLLKINKDILAQATSIKKEKDTDITVEEQVAKTGNDVLIKEFYASKKFRNEVEEFALANKIVPSVTLEEDAESILMDVLDTESLDVPLDLKEKFIKEVAELKENLTVENIKSLAKKVVNTLRNKYKLINSSVNTDNMYHIPTKLTEKEMFEKGYVRVIEDFYKKVDLKYTTEELLDGLYDKYKKGTLPFSMEAYENPYTELTDIEYNNFIEKGYASLKVIRGIANKIKNNTQLSEKENAIFVDKTQLINEQLIVISKDNSLSKEQFIEKMPNTKLDIYKKYYNTTPKETTSKPTVLLANEQYLKEDFKGDFAEFIEEERKKGSKVYLEVLNLLDITDKGILKDKLLSRETIDTFKEDLKGFYDVLLDYSTINKHIDLGVTPQKLIFASTLAEANRLDAVNNPNLVKPKSRVQIENETTISFGGKALSNVDFIKYDDPTLGEGVYEKVTPIDKKRHTFERIADTNEDFIVTKVKEPLNINGTENNTEIEEGQLTINFTDDSKVCKD